MANPPIQDYAVIGDCRSAALVSRSGSIDWLCWPRFESPSLFAALIGADPAASGHFAIAPAGPSRPLRRRYLDSTNVLVTELQAAGGVLRLTDLMPVLSEEEKQHVLVPEHEVLRVVECVSGELEVEARFAPRPGYGRRPPRLRLTAGLGVRLEDGPHLYTLRSDAPLEVAAGPTVVSRFRLRAGERRCFSLTYDAHGPTVLPPLGDYTDVALERTTRWWRRWTERCTYQGPYRAEVIRSLLLLKLLVYAPSGAIVAAPTTSLPERLGGDLNWDYRFCWLRDASLTVQSLLELGFPEEASAFVSWLLHGTRLTRPRLSVLYDVHGRVPGREEVLDHLEGHAGSRPVRINNAAADQLQLDIYGEVIDAVTHMARSGGGLDGETAQLLRQFGQFVGQNWQRPDQGLWEPRSAPRHYTHSRLLCWTAFDRLLELHQMGLLDRLPVQELEENRARVRGEIEARAWNRGLQSYTQVLDGHTVYASLLLMGWYGFALPGDPRLRATFQCLRDRLEVAPALLLRNEESLASGEGAFGICSFWAAEHLARGGGSLLEAETWFRRLLPCANDVGLLAEEVDAATGQPLGNVPQAFTHVGLIGAAVAIEKRRRCERVTWRDAGLHP